jgi:hypothetical protein
MRFVVRRNPFERIKNHHIPSGECRRQAEFARAAALETTGFHHHPFEVFRQTENGLHEMQYFFLCVGARHFKADPVNLHREANPLNKRL